MENKIIEYAPIVLLLFGYFLQYKIFVTPEQLEKKHREILKDCEIKFATQGEVKNLNKKLDEMQKKIDLIYDKLLG